MRQSGNIEPAFKKAYEVSYAVFRVASQIGNAALKEHLERQALSLLDAASVENYSWVKTASRAIECLLKFGGDTGIINPRNAETIISELGILNAAIAGLEKAVMPEPVRLDDIFSREDSFSVTASVPEPANVPNPAKRQSGNEAIRQSAILERIRQSGNCRLREIQEILPDVSERTIRYNLQDLIERGLVERVGSGGPTVFYRIPQKVTFS